MNLLLQDHITAEEFLDLPAADFCELVDGKLVEKHMGAKSSYIAVRLSILLGNYCENPFRGWIFPGDTSYQFLPGRPNLVRKPDVSFVRAGRMPEEEVPSGHIRLAPDLAVEVVSPNDLCYEVEEKVAEYRTAGVPLIWIIIPPTRVVLIRRIDGSCTEVGENGELSGEDVLPGFRCPVSALFEHLRPTSETPPASA
jgi:Uma2 family endonuclease